MRGGPEEYPGTLPNKLIINYYNINFKIIYIYIYIYIYVYIYRHINIYIYIYIGYILFIFFTDIFTNKESLELIDDQHFFGAKMDVGVDQERQERQAVWTKWPG